MRIIKLFFLLPALFLSTLTPAQSDERILMVKGIYAALEEGDASSRYMAALPAGIEQEQVKEINNNNGFSISSILKKEWESLEFKNLQFEPEGKNMIYVSGIVKGRKATECDHLSKRFRHSWVFEKGKIVKFSE
ncbi:hypothetical protein FHG64_06590 [Antarcticibacterium flavum]|uniref:Nuclear transport factor 2 family protein n=1 Tax=Antarcticibacterium flavum TaxID=2058175 RepID=A0A5B7X1B6_9FLAO|nr:MULTISPECIES: hypothetical protein [Antarcticibacterium]MCM4161320.1 hypothetical protein [Antarcticibacterium sp. W02-3]QCY69099.1 hypothetical protein FHG64_06590 [Antarcticibacterium flavum]